MMSKNASFDEMVRQSTLVVHCVHDIVGVTARGERTRRSVVSVTNVMPTFAPPRYHSTSCFGELR